MKRIISLIVLAIILTSHSAWAADAAVALDVHSAYVWRGITLNDGLVAQPGLDVSHRGFGLNVWGNYDIDDYDGGLDDNDFSEVDLTAYYGFKAGKLDVTIGFIHYLFPSSGAEATSEFYAGIGVPVIGGLSASATLYYDVDEVEDYYANLALTYAMDLTDALSLELGAGAGYAGEDFAQFYSTGATDGGFYDYTFSLGLGYAVSDAVSIAAAIHYTGNVDDDALPDADPAAGVAGVDTEVYGGVGVAYSF